MNTPAKPTYRTAESFRLWLGRSEATPTAELLDWCYFGFGRGREADNPHFELFRALPKDGGAKQAKATLVRRIAAALLEHPDLAFPFPGYDAAPDILLYELLSLAGQLICPDELFEPLWNVRNALARNAKALRALPEARLALTKALIFNQRYHPELQKVWLDMTAGKPDPVLTGPPEVGMEGIGMMPGAGDAKQPDRKAVGEGLVNLARYYASNPRRRQLFRAQIFWLKRLWQLPPDYFALLAHEHQWVEQGLDGALLATPGLFVENWQDPADGKYKVIAPSWFIECLRPWGSVSDETPLCNGVLAKAVLMPPRDADQTKREAKEAIFLHLMRELRGLDRSELAISEREATHYRDRILLTVLQGMKKYARASDRPKVICAMSPQGRELVPQCEYQFTESAA